MKTIKTAEDLMLTDSRKMYFTLHIIGDCVKGRVGDEFLNITTITITNDYCKN